MSANNRHRRLGDRKEGRRLRTITPLMAFTPFIMIDRNDACNQFAGSVEISETDRWLRAKRAEGYKGLGMVHLFIAAYIRVLCHLPGLNRFVSGQRVYARNNIIINMMVKRGITVDAEETCGQGGVRAHGHHIRRLPQDERRRGGDTLLRRQRHRERGPHPDWASPAWSSSWPSR